MHTASRSNEALFTEIKTLVTEKLKGLSPDLTYHNVEHTLDVTEQCDRIARQEGIGSERDIYLLKVAALYHDTGFLRTYANHEVVSCQIFLEDASQFGFNEDEKRVVEGLIMATKLPQTPGTPLEKIICDADLDYLGRDDFFEIGDSLRREFLTYGVISSNEEWDKLQIKFLTHHQYHTETSRATREAHKQENISRLP